MASSYSVNFLEYGVTRRGFCKFRIFRRRTTEVLDDIVFTMLLFAASIITRSYNVNSLEYRVTRCFSIRENLVASLSCRTAEVLDDIVCTMLYFAASIALSKFSRAVQ